MRTIALCSRLALAAPLALVACGAQSNEGRDQRESESNAESESASASTSETKSKPRSPLADMLDNPFAAMMMKELDEPGRFDPPKRSDNFDEEAPHLRVLELSGSVSELEAVDPLAFGGGGGGGGVQTHALLAQDDKVAGLVLRAGDLDLDLARAQELREGLIAFRGEGARELHCHAEGLGNMSYYLLSACTTLALVPVGTLSLPGPAATPIHLKGLLDRAGVQAQMLHVGAFKGAAEPLTRDAPSPEMLETLGAIVEQSYAHMVRDIASSRGKSEDQVRGWIDTAMYDPQAAAVDGLIDRVDAWEPFLADVAGERGWTKQKLREAPWSDPEALTRFLGLDLGLGAAAAQPHVALVYAVGNIIDGKGGGALGARGEIASGQLVPVLDALAKDDSVKAVVLRVDSGGGSARASEQIWLAVERLKANKPVVVSMAGVAASGGYYISAGANQIFADADTLTGSIGVVGGKIVLGPALEQWGVKSYAVSKGERALMWSPMQAWTEAEQAAVQANMEQTYEVFLGRVASGRGMERDAVHAIAQGRVWTGEAAKERGLVDELGGLEDALAHAYELAQLEPGAEGVGELERYPAEPTLRDLLGSFEQAVGVSSGLDATLASTLDELEGLTGPGAQPWMFALRRALNTLGQLSSTQVWTLEWTPPLR